MLLPISAGQRRKLGVKIKIKIKPKYGGKMKTSEEGKALIKKFEGCELEAYKCPAGVWTIGYGHIKDVQPGDEWSESHAEHMLEVELEEYENYVNAAVTVPLSELLSLFIFL